MNSTGIVVDKILNIANQYYTQDKSKFILVKESGYDQVYDQITVDVISKELKNQPERIEEWLTFSEDQRTSEGCYFKVENGKNIVAQFSTKNGYEVTENEYPDIATACLCLLNLKLSIAGS